jgi:hypothetical protein
VIDDLACIGCGYNLRGMRVGDRCPECGGHVGDSLFLLARPNVAGRGLNGIGKSFLASFAIIIALMSAATWAPMVATGVIAAGALWRIVHAAELRYRASVVNLPVIGQRIEVFWCCIVVDGLMSLTVFIIAMLHANDPATLTRPTVALGMIAWFMTIMLCMAGAGWLGKPFAVMLGYGWMAIEFSVQRAWIAACAAFAFILLILTGIGAPQIPVLIAKSVFALTFAGGVLLTMVTLMQLANAAFRSSETLDDAIDVYAGDAKELTTKPLPHSQQPGIPLVRD